MIAVARQFEKQPSQIMGIEDSYTAFCFDEACMYISHELDKEQGRRPSWADKRSRQDEDNGGLIEFLRSF